MAYQPYPKVLYRASGDALESRIVQDPVEHAQQTPDWAESPDEAKAIAPPAAPPTDPVVPVEPLPPAVPPDPAPSTPPAEPSSEAASVHAAPIAVLLEKLKGAPAEVLARVRDYETQNPRGPRKTLIEAIDAQLKAE